MLYEVVQLIFIFNLCAQFWRELFNNKNKYMMYTCTILACSFFLERDAVLALSTLHISVLLHAALDGRVIWLGISNPGDFWSVFMTVS